MIWILAEFRENARQSILAVMLVHKAFLVQGQSVRQTVDLARQARCFSRKATVVRADTAR